MFVLSPDTHSLVIFVWVSGDETCGLFSAASSCECVNVTVTPPLPAAIDDLFEVKMSLKCLIDWQSLGLALGLLYPTLEKIEIDHSNKTDKCKMKMLAAWLRQEDNVSQKGVPSWSVLRAALRKMGENELADKIIS